MGCDVPDCMCAARRHWWYLVTGAPPLQYRWNVFKNIRAHIDNTEGGMDKFTKAYMHFGLNRGEHEGKVGMWYREWAPGAQVRPLPPPSACA